MKKYMKFLGLGLMVALAFSACSQNVESGHLKFGMELTATLEKSADSSDYDTQVTGAIITLTDMNGIPVMEKEYLELIRFGNSFVTRSLKIKVGEYMLSEFMLVNAAGEVLWATPKEGSKLAHLVREPLPRYFSIQADETTSLDLQVVRVGSHNPGDFGYVEFYVDFINRFCLQVYFDYRNHYTDNDTIIGYTPGVPWHAPMIHIIVGDKVIEEYLYPGLNRLNLPISRERYTILAFGHFGEVFFEQVFGIEDLKLFSCDPNHRPLYISYGQNPDVVVTPEGLKEPSIRQGVFGLITMPVDDSTDFENYDVYPVIRDIYFYPGTILDSIYTASGELYVPDCYYPEDMIWKEPLAIVRSNSDGFFQLPLESGHYTYLVKTDYGFYIDAFVSSHKPGQVMVYPMEVTKLLIHLVDCSMYD